MKNLKIKSFAEITCDKITTTKGEVKRESPLSLLARDEVYSQKHLGFGKLAFADKLAFGVASLCIESSQNAQIKDPKNCAIVLSTNIGSLHRDVEFMETIKEGHPSPQLFSSTLPSSPIAEIAIVFGLKGANKVIFGDRDFAQKLVDLLAKEGSDEVLFVEINIPEDPADIEKSEAFAWLYEGV